MPLFQLFCSFILYLSIPLASLRLWRKLFLLEVKKETWLSNEKSPIQKKSDSNPANSATLSALHLSFRFHLQLSLFLCPRLLKAPMQIIPAPVSSSQQFPGTANRENVRVRSFPNNANKKKNGIKLGYHFPLDPFLQNGEVDCWPLECPSLNPLQRGSLNTLEAYNKGQIASCCSSSRPRSTCLDGNSCAEATPSGHIQHYGHGESWASKNCSSCQCRVS